MEELLKEVALSERRKKQIDSFVQTLSEALQSVPSFPKVEVCNLLIRPLIGQILFAQYFIFSTSVCSFHHKPSVNLHMCGSSSVTCHGCPVQRRSHSS